MKVFEDKISQHKEGKGDYSLNISKLNPGLYILRMHTSIEAVSKKIIIQNNH